MLQQIVNVLNTKIGHIVAHGVAELIKEKIEESKNSDNRSKH